MMFTSIGNNTKYVVRKKIFSYNDDPFILVDICDTTSFESTITYIIKQIKDRKFVKINMGDSNVIVTDEESHSGHTCASCYTSKNTVVTLGVEICNNTSSTFSSEQNDPSEVSLIQLVLCHQCVREIELMFDIVCDKYSDELVSHLV